MVYIYAKLVFRISWIISEAFILFIILRGAGEQKGGTTCTAYRAIGRLAHHQPSLESIRLWLARAHGKAKTLQ